MHAKHKICTHGQSLIEAILIYSTLICIIIASYAVAKIIEGNLNSAEASRVMAFKDTYKKNKLTEEDLKSFISHDKAKLELKKSKSDSALKNKALKSVEKILNLLNSTKKTDVKYSFKLDGDLVNFIKTIEDNVDLKESLYMDEETCEHSSKLRWALYGIALLKSGFSKNTSLSSIGSDLFEASSDITQNEGFEYE